MKKGIILSIIIIIFLVSQVNASEFPIAYDHYVNDYVGFFNNQEKAILTSSLNSVRQNTTAEVVVVIVNTTSPYVPADYGTKLLNEWGIGKKENNNGLLILYAVKEKRIEVRTGYGLEGILPDSKIGRLLDESYVPLRDRNMTREGIINSTLALVQVIEENKDEVLAGKAGGNNQNIPLWIAVAVILLFIASIIFKIVAKRKTKEEQEETKKKGDYVSVKTYNSLNVVSIIVGFIFFIFISEILGVLVMIVLPILSKIMVGVRCSKDGTRMKYLRKEGNESLYKCKHNHIGKIAVASAAGFYLGSLGGHGGGGFGGGGFGGGMGGGGGAGR